MPSPPSVPIRPIRHPFLHRLRGQRVIGPTLGYPLHDPDRQLWPSAVNLAPSGLASKPQSRGHLAPLLSETPCSDPG